MKFKVSRSSEYGESKSPCEGAYQENFTYVQIRTLGSYQEFDDKFGSREGNWLSKGINHCINEMGYVQREFPLGAIGWFIEINSLEELMKFQKVQGDIIIKKCWENSSIKEIEIYDGYRE